MSNRGERAEDPEVDAEVVVVGAGPVGTALAILLGQRGWRVEVLERWPEPYPLPRAVHFDHETGRILQACGLGGELASISEPADVYEWRNAAGAPLLRFGRTGPGRSGWPQSSMFNQPALEGLLAARADALASVSMRRGREVVAIDDRDDLVLVHHRAHGDRTDADADADDRVTRARWVVGADGANSTVRELAGVPVTDLGFFYDWLIVDVVLDEPRPFVPINVQICDPVRPSTAVSGGPGRRRWEFMRLPGESIEHLDDPEVAWALLEPWDVHPGNATLERHAVYTFQARWADRWRVGRALLAGDAAHQMPPFAGQGMCSGLRDAANLAWRLDLVLAGAAPDRVLDDYERERRPNVCAVIDFSMALGKVICVSDPAEAAERDEAMGAGVVGDEVSEVPELPGITEGLLHASPGAGQLFVQGRVDAGYGPQRFDDVVGSGLRLVARGAGDAIGDPDLAAWFASVGGTVVSVGDGGLADVDGTYARWFDEHDVVAALQRPDYVVFGSAADAAAVDELVGALRSGLTGT